MYILNIEVYMHKYEYMKKNTTRKQNKYIQIYIYIYTYEYVCRITKKPVCPANLLLEISLVPEIQSEQAIICDHVVNQTITVFRSPN